MADITTTWNPLLGRGDWSMAPAVPTPIAPVYSPYGDSDGDAEGDSSGYSESFYTLPGSSGDLLSGNDLATSVLISLMTDRVAQAGYVPPQPSDGNPRGWWGDAFLPPDIGPLGSRLWQLRRAIKNQGTLNAAQDMAAEALQWMITRNVVASFNISAWWLNGTYLAMSIVANKPNGKSQTLPSPGGNYLWVWN